MEIFKNIKELLWDSKTLILVVDNKGKYGVGSSVFTSTLFDEYYVESIEPKNSPKIAILSKEIK